MVKLGLAGRGTRRTPMKIKEGDKLESDLDGNDYRVTRVVNNMVVLESVNRDKQILTGVDNLRIFYKKKEEINR